MQIIFAQKRVCVSGFAPEPADKWKAVIEIVTRERCTMIYTLPPFLHEMITRQVGGKVITYLLAFAIQDYASIYDKGCGPSRVHILHCRYWRSRVMVAE